MDVIICGMPLDRGIIDQQLQALGESQRWWDVRELRDLPAVLHADEQIQALARGKIARVRVLRRAWLIVVTDRRVIGLRSAGPTAWRQFEVSGGQIARVALRIGPFRGRVLIRTPGETFRLLVPRTDAYKLEAALGRLNTGGRIAISGFSPARVVRRVFDHVLALPAVALDPDAARALPPAVPADTSALDRRLQELETEVQELRQQVEFLEDLLQRRQLADGTTAAALPSG